MICNCCSIEKDSSQFYKHSNGKPRRQCKECHLKRSAAWARNNPDKRRELAKRSLERNRENCLLATQRWRKKNLEYDAFRARTYRARRLQAIPSWANLEDIKQFYLNRPEGMHVDHIVPLKGKNVCGLHVLENLQYLSPRENQSKRNIHHV